MVYTSHSIKVGYYSIIKELVRETISTSIRIKGWFIRRLQGYRIEYKGRDEIRLWWKKI